MGSAELRRALWPRTTPMPSVRDLDNLTRLLLDRTLILRPVITKTL